MNTQDFIAYVVLKTPCEFVDELLEEYDLDVEDDEIADILNCLAGDCFHKHHFENFGNTLVSRIFSMIIEKYSDVLDENDFDTYVDGRCSDLIYKGQKIYSKKQLDEIRESMLQTETKQDKEI